MLIFLKLNLKSCCPCLFFELFFDFVKVRLENIKLKNRLKKREMQLKAKVREHVKVFIIDLLLKTRNIFCKPALTG